MPPVESLNPTSTSSCTKAKALLVFSKLLARFRFRFLSSEWRATHVYQLLHHQTTRFLSSLKSHAAVPFPHQSRATPPALQHHGASRSAARNSGRRRIRHAHTCKQPTRPAGSVAPPSAARLDDAPRCPAPPPWNDHDAAPPPPPASPPLPAAAAARAVVATRGAHSQTQVQSPLGPKLARES